MRRGLPLGLLTLVVLLMLAAGVVIARSGPRRAGLTPPAATAPTRPPVAVPTLGPPTGSSTCEYRVAASGGLLPDAACTPGAANPELTREVLCAPGFSTRHYRRVTQAQTRAAYVRYGVGAHPAGEYEIDHLLAIEDGGANDDANLWPEPASPEPGFHQKDLVERYVHRQVCAGVLALAEAQQRIAADWTSLLPAAAQAGLPAKQHTDEGDEDD